MLTVYGLSIFVLALFQAAFGGSVDANFHRGHTAVSAFWGLVGLALLYVGLTRFRALRVAGFVVFAVSLAKIFLFDLTSLTSITRALSFLAVGAVLLLGGLLLPAPRDRPARPAEAGAPPGRVAERAEAGRSRPRARGGGRARRVVRKRDRAARPMTLPAADLRGHDLSAESRSWDPCWFRLQSQADLIPFGV